MPLHKLNNFRDIAHLETFLVVKTSKCTVKKIVLQLHVFLLELIYSTSLLTAIWARYCDSGGTTAVTQGRQFSTSLEYLSEQSGPSICWTS